MAEILLDSDVIIFWLRGHGPTANSVVRLLEEQQTLVWTPVSIAEIFAGVRRSEQDQIERLFLVLEPLMLTAEIGKRAGVYLNTFSKSHGVELGDALIAASASVHDLPLWTFNKKHYPMKDLRFFPLV